MATEPLPADALLPADPLPTCLVPLADLAHDPALPPAWSHAVAELGRRADHLMARAANTAAEAVHSRVLDGGDNPILTTWNIVHPR